MWSAFAHTIIRSVGTTTERDQFFAYLIFQSASTTTQCDLSLHTSYFGKPAQPHSVICPCIPHTFVSRHNHTVWSVLAYLKFRSAGTTTQCDLSLHTSYFGQPAQPHSVICPCIPHMSVSQHNHTVWSVLAYLLFRSAGTTIHCDLSSHTAYYGQPAQPQSEISLYIPHTFVSRHNHTVQSDFAYLSTTTQQCDQSSHSSYFGQQAQPHSWICPRIPHITVSHTVWSVLAYHIFRSAGTTTQCDLSLHTSYFDQPAQPHSVICPCIPHISVSRHNHTVWSVLAYLILRSAGTTTQCDVLAYLIFRSASTTTQCDLSLHTSYFGQPAQPHCDLSSHSSCFSQPAQAHSSGISLRIAHISVSQHNYTVGSVLAYLIFRSAGTTTKWDQSLHTSYFRQPAQPHSVIWLRIPHIWVSWHKHGVTSLWIPHISVIRRKHAVWPVFPYLIFRSASTTT